MACTGTQTPPAPPDQPIATPPPAVFDYSKVPPVGEIWFGESFDMNTLELSGRTKKAESGDTVAFVGRVPTVVKGSAILVVVKVDGQTINNSALNATGEGDVWGATYTLPIPGKYTFRLTDVGANVLATGTITAK